MPLGPLSLKYLEALAADSFKRQADQDESIWRSMPFFIAAAGVAVAIIGNIAGALPAPSMHVNPAVAYGTFTLSMLCFAWALWWLCVVLRPRDYEFPAKDNQVHSYAPGLQSYYAETGTFEGAADTAVESELRGFMFEQYAAAAETNLQHNAERFTARGQVLFFMLAGFVLALVCGAIIFVERSAERASNTKAESHDVSASKIVTDGQSAASPGRATEASTTQGAGDEKGRRVWQVEHETGARGKEMTDKSSPAPPKTPPSKPAPPPSQTIKKNEDTKPRPTTKG